MMIIKQDKNLSLQGLSPQILLGMIIVKGVFDHAEVDLVITCGSNGKHGPGTLHKLPDGTCHAVDIRTKHIQRAVLPSLIEECKKALGINKIMGIKQYDLILEALGTSNEHIHLEYDPAK